MVNIGVNAIDYSSILRYLKYVWPLKAKIITASSGGLNTCRCDI